ncbi:hypothetical protein D3OALGA1CA_2220 [Olavius algarvensis associated proteobacterium Delta 3]|nr:hypothetical protein D3OALGA1CA_2220 [Olavius algarvensis associated proteobacterium Delta 3]
MQFASPCDEMQEYICNDSGSRTVNSSTRVAPGHVIRTSFFFPDPEAVSRPTRYRHGLSTLKKRGSSPDDFTATIRHGRNTT